MKLIVFGATGKTGQHVWQNALGRGHDVTAFTRSPHKLEGVSRRTPDAEGLASELVRRGASTTAVQAAGGWAQRRDGRPLRLGRRRRGRRAVARLFGGGEELEAGPVAGPGCCSGRFCATSMRTAQEALVRTSSMDWTIVRAAILTDVPASGNVTADVLLSAA